MKIQSINPFTEEIVQEYSVLKYEECEGALLQARIALTRWGMLPVAERVRFIRKAGALLRENKDIYARIITEEMGKPIAQSRGEIEKCAWVCDYYSEESESFLREEDIPMDGARSYVSFEPLGVILGIMPWNFPFWQVFRFAIPALAAGNTIVLKHASNVPRTALEIERLMGMAGFPPYVFQTLLMDSETALRLIDAGNLDGVSLTGSLIAGSQVGMATGKAIKKLVLELGGSDPFIVLEDADLEKAARTAVRSRFINGGQSCIAAKRIIVARSVAGDFQDRFTAGMKSLIVGDPMDEATDIGPMARKEFVKDLDRQLKDARDKGAQIITGAEIPVNKGFFFQPAVVANVAPDMRVVAEEVFGPIAPIVIATDEEEAIHIANDTIFGLGASIWSRDIERAQRLARRIEAGCIAINDMVKSDPRLPFGGVKRSGVGRELSHYGLKEFANIKTVVVRS